MSPTLQPAELQSNPIEYMVPAVTGIGGVNVRLRSCKLPDADDIVVLPKSVPLRLSPVITMAVKTNGLSESPATTSKVDRKPEMAGVKVW